MLTVTLWHANDVHEECFGSWHHDEHVQVPRKGDILWLETDTLRHDRWKVVNVQWSFSDRTFGTSRLRTMRAEVWLKRYPTKPLWERFVALFPTASTTRDA